MVICVKRGADLHVAQLMSLPLTVSCFSEIQIGFSFLVPAHPGSPGKRAVKRACVCMPSIRSQKSNGGWCINEASGWKSPQWTCCCVFSSVLLHYWLSDRESVQPVSNSYHLSAKFLIQNR